MNEYLIKTDGEKVSYHLFKNGRSSKKETSWGDMISEREFVLDRKGRKKDVKIMIRLSRGRLYITLDSYDEENAYYDQIPVDEPYIISDLKYFESELKKQK